MVNKYMIRIGGWAILSILSGQVVRGQSSAIPANIRASYAVESLSDAAAIGRNEVIYGVPAPPGKVIGDTYLSTMWRKSAIQLYKDDRIIEGYDTRYDIHADALDVKTTAGVKMLEGRRIRSFSWRDSSRIEPVFFVNAQDFKLEGTPMTGFFEVMADGRAPLLKRTVLQIKKANYNVSFDVGSRDDKILKRADYYMATGNDVVEVGTSKKKMLPLFGDKAAEVEKFIDDNSLSLKKEGDLVKLFEYYNSLLPQ